MSAEILTKLDGTVVAVVPVGKGLGKEGFVMTICWIWIPL